MTVRTLSGATVTLVGRGANYMSADAIIPGSSIIPSFVDADGAQYFIVNDPDDLTAVPSIIDGLFTVGSGAVPPIQIAAANAILVNDPTTNENSTSALVFAKRCGIDVSLEGLTLYSGDDGLQCDNAAPQCFDGAFCLIADEQLAAAFVDGGWDSDTSAYVGCNFEPISTGADLSIDAISPDAQWSNELALRRFAHNAWVFILAGVPKSVFD